MDNLMGCLNVPDIVQEKIRKHSKDEEQQRHECIHYYLKTSPFALRGWGDLGGDLCYYGQEDALTAAKAYIQRAPGTCGCGMCMYWNREDAYITQQIHACSDVYCVCIAVHLLITLMLTLSTSVHMSTSYTHIHTHTYMYTFTCIQSHH